MGLLFNRLPHAFFEITLNNDIVHYTALTSPTADTDEPNETGGVLRLTMNNVITNFISELQHKTSTQINKLHLTLFTFPTEWET
jgi:hypothetical protein